ncbi:MAG: hypothetical protein J5726_03985 [Treponema sp.]|nr:hypothetical protein [Treponema sp.]
MNKKLTLLAFKNTSAELLVKGLDFSTVFLPSDKIKDSEIARAEIEKSDIVICFGQKPQIKNKICLELVAKNQGEIIKTNFDLEPLKHLLETNNIVYTESYNPGSSYCNLVYWNSLNYIKDQKFNCKFLFIHIPFEKNIDDILTLQEKLNIIIKNI